MADVQVQQFNDWIAKGQDAAVNNAATILDVSRETKPDELAADIKLGKAFGIPADVAGANRDWLTNRLDAMHKQTLMSSAPALTGFVTNRDNAALAQDDLENLSWIEGAARGFTNMGRKAVTGPEQVYQWSMFTRFHDRYQRRGKSFQELADETAGKGPWGTEYIDAAVKYLDNAFADALGVDDAQRAQQWAVELSQTSDYRNSLHAPQVAQDFMAAWTSQNTDTLGSAVMSFVDAAVHHPIGALASALDGLATGLPAIGVGLATTAATKNPVAGLNAGAAVGFGLEYADSAYSMLAELGIDLKNPADVQRMLNDPSLLKRANERGIVRAAIIGMFDRISGGLAGKTLARNPLVEHTLQVIQETISGGLGEHIAQQAAGQQTNYVDSIMEAAAEALSLPFDYGVAGRDFLHKRNLAKIAETQKEAIGTFLDGVAKSKLKERAAGKFEEFMKSALETTGLKDFYIPAEAVRKYFQPDDARRILNVDVEDPDFQAMINAGADVRVPVERYTSEVVNTPLDALLRDHLRLDPSDMTAAEASEFNAKSEDAMQQAFAEAEQARMQEESLRSDEQKIYDEMVSQLRRAGRTTEVAMAEAMIFPALYRTMAARLGTDVKALVDRFVPPAVRGALPEGLKLKDITEFDRRLEELRSAKKPKPEKRQNLLGFIDKFGGISDPGGELNARDAKLIKQGAGKKTLRLLRDSGTDGQSDMLGPSGTSKHSMDNVARAAMEAGFMAEDPAVIEYKAAMQGGRQTPDLSRALIDAIDRELAGQNDFGGVDDGGAAEKAAMLADAEDYLASLGVSLDDPNPVIKAAMERDGKRYNQVDPLADKAGAWRDLAISATLEDGEVIQVHAGDYVDLLQDRIKSAEELLACVVGA